ncbi:MAG: hypothetical protein RLZZ444_3884, partial [Pseudomonadota bacterium]
SGRAQACMRNRSRVATESIGAAQMLFCEIHLVSLLLFLTKRVMEVPTPAQSFPICVVQFQKCEVLQVPSGFNGREVTLLMRQNRPNGGLVTLFLGKNVARGNSLFSSGDFSAMTGPKQNRAWQWRLSTF